MNKHKKFRWLQFISGIHRIHHIWWSYGWKLPFVPVAHFSGKSGWKIVRRDKYLNCTMTGKY